MTEDFIKIIVKDGTDRRIDSFVCNLSDEESMTRIFKILKTKYGMKINMKELDDAPDFLSFDNDFLKF